MTTREGVAMDLSPDEIRLWQRLENVKSGIGACMLTAAGGRPDGEEAIKAHQQILKLVEDGLAIRRELGLDPLEPPAPAPPLEPEPVTEEWFRSRRPAPPPPPRHRVELGRTA